MDTATPAATPTLRTVCTLLKVCAAAQLLQGMSPAQLFLLQMWLQGSFSGFSLPHKLVTSA